MNDNQYAPGETPHDNLENVGRFPWAKLLKVFLIRIPLWLVVLVFLAIGIFIGYSSLKGDDPVNLRPVVSDAREVEITITTCDQIIDDRNIEIRDAEKKFEEKFVDRENVSKANVRIDRADDDQCRSVAEEK